MVMWSSLGEIRGLWGLDGNFTTCYRQLINISKSHGVLQFQCYHWWPRALGCFSYGCFMGWHHCLKSYEYTFFWRNVSDFLQPVVTEGDVACTPSCASMSWLTPWDVDLSQGVSPQTCTCGSSLGSHLAPRTAAANQPRRGNDTNPSAHSSDWSGDFHLVEEAQGKTSVWTDLRQKSL